MIHDTILPLDPPACFLWSSMWFGSWRARCPPFHSWLDAGLSWLEKQEVLQLGGVCPSCRAPSGGLIASEDALLLQCRAPGSAAQRRELCQTAALLSGSTHQPLWDSPCTFISTVAVI